jgi:predicted LPLAT superfamily acyltransferase
MDAAAWHETPERGSPLLLAVFSRLCLALGRPFGRFIVLICTLYYFVRAKAARAPSRAYLQRVLGRAPRAADRYRHIFCFASTILDRFYLIRGRYGLFDVAIEGKELMAALAQRGRGAFLLGAHLGSFEVVSAVGRQLALPVSMVMYEANARRMSTVLRALNPAFEIDIIPIGTPGAMLELRDRLEQGRFVGMLADRTMADQPACTVSFLGEEALLPLGPMRMAALLRREVIFMAGIYEGGNRYRVVFEPVADFSDGAPAEAALAAAVGRYAQALERLCRRYPYNWFNFYNFWSKPLPPDRDAP